MVKVVTYEARERERERKRLYFYLSASEGLTLGIALMLSQLEISKLFMMIDNNSSSITGFTAESVRRRANTRIPGRKTMTWG